MKNLLLAFLFCFSLNAATPLGVLYESSNTNNVVSPPTLTQGNLRVDTNLVLNMAGIVANRALRVMADKNVTTSSLTSTQQDYLATWVGGINTLVLGGAMIVSGDHTPTNGTTYVQRILYINSTGTNLNDTFWGNYGSSWYAIASTNGGSIIESQINFSNNTTGDADTNHHGFELRLINDTTKFKRSDGVWAVPNNILSNTLASGTRYVGFYDPGSGAYTYYKTNFATINGTSLILPNIDLLTGGEILGDATTDMLIGDVSAWNTMGINGVAASSLLRLDSLNKVRAVTIGTGLNWDGTTLSSTGGGTNSVAISGSPVSGNVTYWTDGTHISGNNNFVFDGSKLTVTHYGVPSEDLTGQLTGGHYTPIVTPVNYLGTPTCNLIGASPAQAYYTKVGKNVTVVGKAELNGSGAFPRIIFQMNIPTSSGTVSGGEVLGTFTCASPSGARLNPLLNASITQSGGAAYFIYEANGGALAGLVDFYFTFSYREP